jgi:HD-GYP domain-containing protein (c-di-GMP phosphodiesterase class II)
MTGGTRPDRAKLSRAEALAELARCAGSHFDPTLVKEFTVIAEASADEGDLDLVADLVASTRSMSESAVPLARRSDQRGAP